ATFLLSASLSVDAGEDQMQFLRLTEQLTRLGRKGGLRSGDYAKKILCFFRFFYAASDGVSKVLSRDALVSLAIICTDACAAANELVDQSIVCCLPRDLLRKAHNRFGKPSGAFFQVE